MKSLQLASIPDASVLVTAPSLPPAACTILMDAGLELRCMLAPVTEDALIAAMEMQPTVAIVVRGAAPITRRVLDAGESLTVVAKHGVGIDSIDVQAATRADVAVTVAAGANADAVAEHAIAMMLGLMRDLPRLDRRVRRGVWENMSHEGRDFRGSTVGVVGYGSIGRRTAALARALGARVLVHSRSARAGNDAGVEFVDDLDALLPRVDVLSVHCPLTERTRGLVGRREIGLLRPGALIVNTARGGIVDEAALVDALREGRLAGAGLDTFAAEPVPRGHPLLTMDNVICTPHVAGLTRDARMRVSTLAAGAIVSLLRGEHVPADMIVNPLVLERSRAS